MKRFWFGLVALSLVLISACTPTHVPWDGAEPVTDREKVTMETCDCLYDFFNNAAGLDMEHLMEIIPKYKKDQKKVVEDKMTIPEFREKWKPEMDEIQKGQKAMQTFAGTDCGKKALEHSPQEENEEIAASTYFRDHCRYLFLFEQKF